MGEPRTAREALIAEMIGDLDVLLARSEALPALVSAAEENIARTVAALADAGDKYRMAVTAFSEQAKAELTDYLEHKASKTSEEMRATLQDIAQQALAKEFRRAQRSNMVQIGIAALIASGLTACFVYAIIKIH